MQFLKITQSTTLSDLASIVGARNVESVLHLNGLNRSPNIGRQFYNLSQDVVDNAESVSAKRKNALLNTVVGDSDIFETVALLDESGWKLFSETNILPDTLKLPSELNVPDSTSILGNSIPIKSEIYTQAINQLNSPSGKIDPSIFNEYSVTRASTIIDYGQVPNQNTTSNPIQWFPIPWGDVVLYSTFNDELMVFPVYPEELSDHIQATYDTMPDLLYQYEPWQIYKSSGPRNNSYTFIFHRDMWTGDHRDGKANDLIRMCEANCYPDYKGAAVNTSQVTLYIKGYPLISGVLTDVNVDWSGPLGLDGWYLVCKLELTIIEVSKEPLNYEYVRQKPLIG